MVHILWVWLQPFRAVRLRRCAVSANSASASVCTERAACEKQKVCMKTTEGLSSDKRPTDQLTHVKKSLTYRASFFLKKHSLAQACLTVKSPLFRGRARERSRGMRPSLGRTSLLCPSEVPAQRGEGGTRNEQRCALARGAFL